jgi:hypothetical protein
MKRWQFRLVTLLLVLSVVAVPLAIYGNYRQRLRRQEAAIQVVRAKGGTVFYSSRHVFVDFSLTAEPKGMGVLCSNERVICPDYAQHPTFCDADLQLLSDILHLYDVDFRRSKVTEKAARDFQKKHTILSRGLDTVTVD